MLFMVEATKGGMGMSDEVAKSIYGLYTTAVFLITLPGGWLADRLLGAQRPVQPQGDGVKVATLANGSRFAGCRRRHFGAAGAFVRESKGH